MKFWAIAYQYQEDVYVNIETYQDTTDLTEKCFLPSESLAKQIIEDGLSEDYVPVSIELERLERNGSWTYSRGKVGHWDNEE